LYIFNKSRLLQWWKDDPNDPGRMLLNDPGVQNLVNKICPDSKASDLGGTMSLNVMIESCDKVLRIHQPFVSRRRLLAIQELRYGCIKQGLVVPAPIYWNNSSILRYRNRWAELEQYIPHERLKPTLESYIWLFRAMGMLHHTLASLDLMVPRPLVATYATPTTLRRWSQITETAVQGDLEAISTTRLLSDLVRRLSNQWISSSDLPIQLVHGDVRLSNVCQAMDEKTVYFDFGFAAYRPRIHDLAYALAFMILAKGGMESLDNFKWQEVRMLIEEYESVANARLTSTERRAIAPYTAAIPIYQTAIAGLSNNPAQELRSKAHLLRVSDWMLAHPEALMG
jgi:Ser/Thr protein kinase RdoA (MazF antagonist)